MNHRQTLISSGEHLYAICRLGDNYTVEQFLEAVTEAREVNAGERYADSVLGPDSETITATAEPDPTDDDGEATVRAAEANLRRRGIDPAKATYAEFAAALERVSQ
jgi:hypothetical protein